MLSSSHGPVGTPCAPCHGHRVRGQNACQGAGEEGMAAHSLPAPARGAGVRGLVGALVLACAVMMGAAVAFNLDKAALASREEALAYIPGRRRLPWAFSLSLSLRPPPASPRPPHTYTYTGARSILRVRYASLVWASVCVIQNSDVHACADARVLVSVVLLSSAVFLVSAGRELQFSG